MSVRPFSKAQAAPPQKLGDLILAALAATAHEKEIQCDYREGRRGLDDITKAARVALAAEDAVWRRLREIGGES